MHPATPYRLLAASLAALCTLPALAQDGPATGSPATVEARLQARDIRYEVDDDGDFRVTYSWRDEGRTQLVFVGGDTQRAGELRIREVFAPVARVGVDGLDAGVADALLRDNSRKIFGHWALNDAYLVYVVQVPDSIDAAGLETAMDFAAEIADNKEIELTQGKDEF